MFIYVIINGLCVSHSPYNILIYLYYKMEQTLNLYDEINKLALVAREYSKVLDKKIDVYESLIKEGYSEEILRIEKSEIDSMFSTLKSTKIMILQNRNRIPLVAKQLNLP